MPHREQQHEQHRRREELAEKMRRERWPHVSDQEWRKMKAELLEEMKCHGF